MSNDFHDPVNCVKGDKAKKCALADPVTEAAKTPPAGCTVYLADAYTNTCSAWVMGCTPGVRTATDTSGVEADVAALQASVGAVEAKTACQSVSGTDLILEGCNLHIRNGGGVSYAQANGLGNLIIGYDEDDGTDTKTGSHTLVIGRHHTYTSSVGFVAGENNTISGGGGSVSGGAGNTASGTVSSVSGGGSNTASALYASVSGGLGNTAVGDYSSVSGGMDNTAEGSGSAVSGGMTNTASGWTSTVVSGGSTRTAPGTDDWAAGGLFEAN